LALGRFYPFTDIFSNQEEGFRLGKQNKKIIIKLVYKTVKRITNKTHPSDESGA
jgi:hypothetical protein